MLMLSAQMPTCLRLLFTHTFRRVMSHVWKWECESLAEYIEMSRQYYENEQEWQDLFSDLDAQDKTNETEANT